MQKKIILLTTITRKTSTESSSLAFVQSKKNHKPTNFILLEHLTPLCWLIFFLHAINFYILLREGESFLLSSLCNLQHVDVVLCQHFNHTHSAPTLLHNSAISRLPIRHSSWGRNTPVSRKSKGRRRRYEVITHRKKLLNVIL